MKKCPSCNSYNDELNAICEYCGIQFPDAFSENSFNENDKQSIYDNSGQYNDNAQGNYNQDNYNQGNFDMNNYRTTEQEKSGVWALVFGIISLFCLPISFHKVDIHLQVANLRYKPEMHHMEYHNAVKPRCNLLTGRY